MSKLGVFQIPGEFKSEDRWLRYFNRKQAIVLVLCGVVDYKAIIRGSNNGLLIPVIIIMLLITLLVMGSVMIRLPVDVMFLNGGGITIDELLFRIMYRKLHREICVKNYEETSEEEI